MGQKVGIKLASFNPIHLECTLNTYLTIPTSLDLLIEEEIEGGKKKKTRIKLTPQLLAINSGETGLNRLT